MRLVVALALALLVPGCLDPVTDRLRASNVEPPEWSVGDWWTYRLNSTTYAIDGVEITLVVANVTGAGYVLGYAAGQDVTLPMLFHMPALGPVSDELAYDVHEARFEPLSFPLEDGKEWETTWITARVDLTARLVNGTWRINNTGAEESGGLNYDIVYDPAAKAIARFTRAGADGVVRQQVELVANGTGYEGEVVAPGAAQVILLESRTAGSTSGGAPAPPAASFSVPEGIDTLLVGCLAGGQPGQYHAEVRSAAGIVCQVDVTVPPGGGDVSMQVVEAPAEGEGWEARLAAVGPGSATAEVLGYSTRVVTLGNATAP